MSRAGAYASLPPDIAERWAKFGRGEADLYVNLLGFEVEDVRVDYCRMRMPFRNVLNQAAGIVHGGAIAGLLDSVVVPAVGSAYPPQARYATVDMHVQFLAPLVADDAVAEGWVVSMPR